MNLIWITILALVAGLDGRLAVGAPAGPRPSIVEGPRPMASTQARWLAPARHSNGRPNSSPWTISGLDELDTEEVDDTWSTPLDASGPSALDWSARRLPRSSFDPGRSPRLAQISRLGFPLRC